MNHPTVPLWMNGTDTAKNKVANAAILIFVNLLTSKNIGITVNEPIIAGKYITKSFNDIISTNG